MEDRLAGDMTALAHTADLLQHGGLAATFAGQSVFVQSSLDNKLGTSGMLNLALI